MANNALVNIIKSGDRDALNSYLAQQTIGGDSGGVSLDGVPNNALTALVRGNQMQPMRQPVMQDVEQPMNTIRTSSGQYLTPMGDRSNAPVGFASAPSQPQFQGSPVDVIGQGKGYMQPDGSIVGVNQAGQRFTVNPAGTEAMRQAQMDQQLNRQMKQAQIADTMAQIQQRQQLGKTPMPTFNADAGGYVYPPSPENPQGKFVPVPGFQPGGNKPLTEYQGQSVMFGTRAADAHNQLNALEDTINKPGLKAAQTVENIPLVGSLANTMLSPQQQQVDQAQRNFVNAILRRESGASISASEFDNAKKQYFPQPGDSPQVIEQKRNNRDMAIKGFALGAGPMGSKDIMNVYNANPYGKSAAHPQDNEAVAWAKANPNDPRAAKILQLAGG